MKCGTTGRLKMRDVSLDDVEVVLSFTVMGEPVSKARPRMGKNHQVYTPAKTSKAEEQIGWEFKKQVRYRANETAAFSVYIDFYLGTTNGASNQRDIDNMAKTVLDALNHICWWDDKQVVELHCRKFLPPCGKPRTVIQIREVGEFV
jgi:Holliday junction resolvase RusA-like endonuclease